MINIIRSKLLKNLKSKLSIEELNVLYGLDCDFIDELVECRYKRDKYEDFCFIFDKNKVACTPLNINENTICYIGDLIIEKVLPTYNLKYIGGLINFKNLLTVDDLKKLEDRIILDMYVRMKNKIKSVKKVLVRK